MHVIDYLTGTPELRLRLRSAGLAFVASILVVGCRPSRTQQSATPPIREKNRAPVEVALTPAAIALEEAFVSLQQGVLRIPARTSIVFEGLESALEGTTAPSQRMALYSAWLRTDPGNEEVLGRVVALGLRLPNQREGALALCRQFTTSSPRSPQGWRLRLKLALGAKDAAAVDIVKEALALPLSPRAKRSIAEMLLRDLAVSALARPADRKELASIASPIAEYCRRDAEAGNLSAASMLALHDAIFQSKEENGRISSKSVVARLEALKTPTGTRAARFLRGKKRNTTAKRRLRRQQTSSMQKVLAQLRASWSGETFGAVAAVLQTALDAGDEELVISLVSGGFQAVSNADQLEQWTRLANPVMKNGMVPIDQVQAARRRVLSETPEAFLVQYGETLKRYPAINTRCTRQLVEALMAAGKSDQAAGLVRDLAAAAPDALLSCIEMLSAFPPSQRNAIAAEIVTTSQLNLCCGSDVAAHSMLGEALVEQCLVKQAKMVIQRALSTTCWSEDEGLGFLRLLLRAFSPPDTVRPLWSSLQVVDAIRENEEALMIPAEILLARGKPTEADAVLAASLKLEGKAARGGVFWQTVLERCWGQMPRLDVHTLSKAIASGALDDDPDQVLQLADELLELHGKAGDTPASAVQFLVALLPEDGKVIGPHLWLAQAERGADGGESGSIDVLKHAATLFPESVEIRLKLARAHLDADDVPSALPILVKLSQTKPDCVETWEMLVDVYSTLEDDAGVERCNVEIDRLQK